MPTGYTTDIYNGVDVSFKTFALTCARAFGACMHQRDDKPDVLPQLVKPDISYHLEQLKRAKNIKKPTKKEYEQYKKEKIEMYKLNIEKNTSMVQRYEKMLEQVKKWEPPTSEHVGLKNFMIQQLESSISFDGSFDYYRDKVNESEQLTYNQYVIEVMDNKKRSIKYHKDGIEKEKQRAKQANDWIKKLYKSL